MLFQVWDTGGQQRYRPVLSSCYRNVHGIIMVFDVTNVKSFANLPQWIKEVKEFAPNQGGVPKLLIGNKSDLEDRREVTPEIAEAFAKENSMSYIETSAIATTNIREAFMALLQSNNDWKWQISASSSFLPLSRFFTYVHAPYRYCTSSVLCLIAIIKSMSELYGATWMLRLFSGEGF